MYGVNLSNVLTIFCQVTKIDGVTKCCGVGFYISLYNNNFALLVGPIQFSPRRPTYASPLAHI